ncbi:MAG: glycogen synthase [Patescibacteria group bacterium]
MGLFNQKTSLKILFVAPEATPFAKAGGLGEVMFSLPKALNKIGHDARVMIPRYAGIDLEKFRLQMELEGLQVPTDSKSDKDNEPAYLTCNVRKYVPMKGDQDSPVFTYFLENLEYYEKRSNVYGYADDGVRWALLCRGVLEFLSVSRDWLPDIIVASDWQTGFLPNYLKTLYKDNPRLQKIASVFLIHNLYYQGMFDHRYVSELDFDDGQSAIPPFFDPRLLKINGMRRGILYGDLINTVSPNYSQEIMTKDYGELLDDLLKEKRAQLRGILNGINYNDFNPETDKNLAVNYSADSLGRREKNKMELQARFGLPKDKDIPIVAIVSRLMEQKGFDLLFLVAEALLKALNFQLIVVGAGEAKYMGFFKDLADRYPKQVAAHLIFDKILPHVVYGGADMILIPSKFEPSGLVQMEAMRYGVAPIVRKTGGLADSVQDYDPKTGEGNGFVFQDFDSMALTIAITRASENYRNPKIWAKIQKSAMARDFSWEKSAEEYSKLFEDAAEIKKNVLG